MTNGTVCQNSNLRQMSEGVFNCILHSVNVIYITYIILVTKLFH
jgi:hypothetical protein